VLDTGDLVTNLVNDCFLVIRKEQNVGLGAVHEIDDLVGRLLLIKRNNNGEPVDDRKVGDIPFITRLGENRHAAVLLDKAVLQRCSERTDIGGELLERDTDVGTLSVYLQVLRLFASRNDLTRCDRIFQKISVALSVQFLTLLYHIAQIHDLAHVVQRVFINSVTHVKPHSLKNFN